MESTFIERGLRAETYLYILRAQQGSIWYIFMTPVLVIIYVAALCLITTFLLWPTKICKATDLSSIYLSPTYPLKTLLIFSKATRVV